MALFTIELPNGAREYLEFINNVIKMTISLLVAFLVFRTASSKKNFMDISFLELYSYLLIGIAFNDLLVKDVVVFV
jgi:hypothetical protein